MSTLAVTAQFDGHVFIPRDPISLPIGTTVRILVRQGANPPIPTSDDDHEWQNFLEEIQSNEPTFASVEEALDYTRGRP